MSDLARVSIAGWGYVLIGLGVLIGVIAVTGMRMNDSH